MFTLNEISTFGRGKDLKQRKKKAPGYNSNVRKQNVDFLYKNMYGGDKYARELANNKNNKLDYKLSKQYIRDMATNYENGMNGSNVLDTNKVNRGMKSINKKYKQYF